MSDIKKGTNELLEDIHVRIPKQLYNLLVAEAKRNNTNISEMTRIIFNSYFEGEISDITLLNDTITQQAMKLHALDKKMEVASNFLLCFIQVFLKNMPNPELDFSDDIADYNYRRFIDSAMAKIKHQRPGILQDIILNYMQEG